MLCNYSDELNERRRNLDTSDAKAIYELSFWAHYILVTIHPWVDRNGRTTRLLMNLLQMEYGVLPMKIYKEEKKEYIQSLIDSREQDDISIFIRTMMMMQESHLSEEIKQFQISMEDEMSGKNVRKELTERQCFILNLIGDAPSVTVNEMSEKTTRTRSNQRT